MNLIVFDKPSKESKNITCFRKLLFAFGNDIFSNVLSKYNLGLNKYLIVSCSYECIRDETVMYLSNNFGIIYYAINKDIKLSIYKVIGSLKNTNLQGLSLTTNYKDFQERKSQISSKSNEHNNSSKNKTIIPLKDNNYIRLQNERDLSYSSYGNS